MKYPRLAIHMAALARRGVLPAATTMAYLALLSCLCTVGSKDESRIKDEATNHFLSPRLWLGEGLAVNL